MDDDKLDFHISNDLLKPAMAYDLAAYAANIFLNHYHRNDKILPRAISVLYRLATSNDAGIAQAGLQGLFPLLAERLSDAFNPSFCNLYDLAFSRVISFCRRHPAGRHIDKTLTRFGLQSNKKFIARKNTLRNRKPFSCNDTKRYRKCIILSRVTLGAEVAVTSIAIAKLLEVFPNAEVILIGNKNFADIFFEVPRLHVRHCHYPAGGGLLERMHGWIDALAIVDNEIRALSESTYIVIDPDSRFTQLGLLPLVENEANYLFFESRSFQHSNFEKISSLTNCWLTLNFGGSDASPFINLSDPARNYAHKLRSRLTAGKNILTSVSLGVGGNNRKRLGPAFELA
ncbi:hypothetical protein ACFL0M_09985, partial [Thermodesulfobacteriota bacterium]